MADGKVPVLESVGAATRTFAQNWRFAAIAGALTAAGATALTLLTASAPALALVFTVLTTLLQAYVYAALIGAALNGPGSVLSRLGADGGRIWAAMAIIGFLLTIVVILYTIFAAIVLAFGAPEAVTELGAAGQDQAAVMAAFGAFAEEEWGLCLFLALAFIAVWMLLTSRLFVSAPATYDAQRILTFETWKWTKGNMLRITAARALLLFPTYAVLFAITWGISGAVGIDPMDPTTAQNNMAVYAGVTFFSQFLGVAAYSALEAALSSYLYRGLRPQPADAFT